MNETATPQHARRGSDRPPIVVYEDVVKRFGTFTALNGVSAQINAARSLA